VTGTPPKALAGGAAFASSLIVLVLLAAALCVLAGLSFDYEGHPAGAWYVLAVVAAMQVLIVLPFWLAREPPAKAPPP
jgi:hypothetical protein